MAKKTTARRASSQPLDLEHFVPFLLNSVARRFNARLEKVFRVKRLTIHDWRLLATLANTELERPAEIADYIAVDPSTLSRMIDRFAQAGVIARHKPAGEARITELHLTSLGRALYDTAFEIIAAERDRLLASLTVQERDQFMRLLVKLHESYEPSAVLPVRTNGKSAA
jgi:DNA-binding MarR family transcriptional regulator